MTTRLPRSAKRSPREWALRGGLAVVALVLGYVSTTQTLAFALGRTGIERAHALSPGDGRIAASLAEQLSASEIDPARRARTDRIAAQALLDEPLAVSALASLALSAQLRGDAVGARKLLLHSDRLSRRDFATQLLLIEDAAASDNLDGALRSYDVALRTSRNAPDILFPVLSTAIAAPEVATALARTLATKPPWGEAFIRHQIASGPDIMVTQAFLKMLVARQVAIPGEVSASFVNALAAKGRFQDAWASYRALRPQVDRRRSRDPSFGALLEHPTVFDWTPVMDAPGITAAIEQKEKGGLFTFSAPSTVGGVVLQQTQIAPPGTYVLDGVMIAAPQSEGNQAYWQIACADGRELGRVEMPAATGQQVRFRGAISITAECPVQVLRLIVRPMADVMGTSGQIERVELRARDQS